MVGLEDYDDGWALDTPDVILLSGAGHRGSQTGEHRARSMHPRTALGVSQHGRELRRQTRSGRQAPQQPHPSVRHHPRPSAEAFTRETAALLFTKKVAFRSETWTSSSPHYPLQDRHFR